MNRKRNFKIKDVENTFKVLQVKNNCKNQIHRT